MVDEMVATTGAILAGRRGYDLGAGEPDAKAYGGRWNGPIFVCTHHPDDVDDPGFTFLRCDITEAVEIARAAAGGTNLGVLPASTTARPRWRSTCATGRPGNSARRADV